jgi:predicted MFS family arabinose efflux permease
VLCGGIYFSAIRPDLDVGSGPPPAEQPSEPARRGALAQAMRGPVFWALALSFTAYTATYSAFMFHLYPLLGERGLSPAGAVAVISCVGPAQVAGRVLIWAFARQSSVRGMGAVVVGIFPVAFAAIFFLPPTVLAMAAVASLYGAGNGVMTIVRGMAVPEMLSRQAYGAVNGALTAPSFVARAMAPAGAAALWAATGGYDGVLAAIVTGAVLTAVGFWAAALFSVRSGPV